MADTGRVEVTRRVVVCDDKCGCSIPCSGDTTCRCTNANITAGSDHSTCSCGEHCECNPCSCPKTVAAGIGCKCAPDCTCASCRT
ncbi:hypothetical protein RIF29_29554 [Crotalaria pallida]|uniref:Metallothionein n=1 Tax=Crotalaria pallida TaxID=3830 RepID=A0AAN9HWC9_CROPI